MRMKRGVILVFLAMLQYNFKAETFLHA